MRITSSAVALLTSFPAVTLVQGRQCLSGSFFLEIEGSCTPEAVVSAYENQVLSATGATKSSCALTAEADLTAKLAAAGLDLEKLCKQVYDTQEKVPFTDASKRGTNMHFENMFFNGHSDWQEEVETKYESEDRSATSNLNDDAERVRLFFDGIAQSSRVEWPGSMAHFQSAVTDGNGLATCTTNAAMCCWPKDRQANDGNGNCATAYDENCVDKDPADNTDLCYVDLERGNKSTGLGSTDIIVYPGDNDDGEGAIHCHGLAWSNDVNHHTARYKANNMFFVSMYDHMYQRGYVKNIPGAPMCGCVEQMPTVSRSDCTQVDLTESFEISYNADTNTFKTNLASVNVEFNACQGINNRNNDLWAYIARLYYEGHVTPKQFGQAGRIITDTDCEEATKYELDKKGMTPGYDHNIAYWTNVAGRESMKLNDGYGHRAFNKSLRPGNEPGSDPGGRSGSSSVISDSSGDGSSSSGGSSASSGSSSGGSSGSSSSDSSDSSSSGSSRRLSTLIGSDSSRSNSHYGIILRVCQPCVRTHMKIFYRRRTPIPDGFSLIDNILYETNDGGGRNVWDEDFSLHSTYDDALNDRNPWNCPNDEFDYDTTFYGECSPDGARVRNQQSQFQRYTDKHDIAYYTNKPEDDGLVIVPTTAIKGRDYAGGIALKDPEDGTIYMTGSGRDIWNWGDDFNYMSQPVRGDHTAIVHAGSISSPDPAVWSKSGIMFRSTLDPTSAHYSILLTGSEGVCAQGRLTTGSYPKGWACVEQGATDAWLKIEKRKDTYTSYVGSQNVENGPITWTEVHTRNIPGIGDSYNVGLAVSSKGWYAQEVVFKNYEVDIDYFSGATASVRGTPTTKGGVGEATANLFGRN